MHQIALNEPSLRVLSIDDVRERTRAFCVQRPVQKLELFGSVAHGDASATSDVDLLVTFDPEADFGMFEFLRYKEELETALGRRVDLLERPAVESSTNPFLKHYILRSAQMLYERA